MIPVSTLPAACCGGKLAMPGEAAMSDRGAQSPRQGRGDFAIMLEEEGHLAAPANETVTAVGDAGGAVGLAESQVPPTVPIEGAGPDPGGVAEPEPLAGEDVGQVIAMVPQVGTPPPARGSDTLSSSHAFMAPQSSPDAAPGGVQPEPVTPNSGAAGDAQPILPDLSAPVPRPQAGIVVDAGRLALATAGRSVLPQSGGAAEGALRLTIAELSPLPDEIAALPMRPAVSPFAVVAPPLPWSGAVTTDPQPVLPDGESFALMLAGAPQVSGPGGAAVPAHASGAVPPPPVAPASLSPVILSLAPGEGIELTLSPEELGRVRIEMVPDGDSLRILIAAERPETVDLLRRHAADLLAELRSAGLSAGDMTFSGWSDGRKGPDPHGADGGKDAAFAVTATPPSDQPALRPPSTHPKAHGRLDLLV